MTRRALIRRMGVATLIPLVPVAPAAPATGIDGDGAATADAAAPAAERRRNTYVFLNADEVAFLAAACACLIPSDDTGPGATEANVVNYFDKQLGGAWGAGERLYRSGPWQAGTPQQGYQLPFTPAEFFRTAIKAIGDGFRHDGAPFHERPVAEQEAWLHRLEKGELPDLGPVPAKAFFQALWDMTLEGFLADPVYGGNEDMVGWKLLGFPGAYANFYELVDQHGRRFEGRPVSLGEDAGGHVHPAPDIRANAHGQGRA